MKRGFLFAGQGSQFVGMGKDFYENFDFAKEMFNKADDIVPDLKKVCFEGPDEVLKETRYTQPGIFVVSAIIDKILKDEKGIKPDAVAGFSLGEYSALYSAGCFDFETGLRLVSIRGEAMSKAGEKNSGAMAAIIGLSDEVVEEVCKDITAKGETVVPVNYNCDGQLVISGTEKGVKESVEILKEKGAKRAVVLKVSGAFHSPLMEPAVDILKEAIEKSDIKVPSIPLYMNATSEKVLDVEKIKELMLKQLISPVLWKQSVRNMIKDGIEEFIELGPGRVLSGFMRNIDRNVKISNIQKLSDL